jgi:hypothetical protein
MEALLSSTDLAYGISMFSKWLLATAGEGSALLGVFSWDTTGWTWGTTG